MYAIAQTAIYTAMRVIILYMVKVRNWLLTGFVILSSLRIFLHA